MEFQAITENKEIIEKEGIIEFSNNRIVLVMDSKRIFLD